MSLSPMMQQYLDIKEQYKDCVLFFRLGDFYEMFFEDAVNISKELELVLTGKSCGLDERAPMCGIPFHSSDTYIARLVEKGYKVAVCEQVEDPSTTKGLVKREVVQVITPGTVTKQSMLNEKENNYLACVYISEDNIALAYCDVSTGEFSATKFPLNSGIQTLTNELVRINTKELLISESALELLPEAELIHLLNLYINKLPDTYFELRTSESVLLKHFDIAALGGIGLADNTECICACGGLLSYLFETQKQTLSHISKVALYEVGNHMALDKATIRNLELTQTLYEKRVQGSLLGVIDKTGTAMGSRKLKQWIREPLNITSEINQRLDAVEILCDDVLLRNNLSASLKHIYDLERLSGRIACGNANGKDMIALRNSIAQLPEIKADLSQFNDGLLANLDSQISAFEDVFAMIDKAICEEPPITIKEGSLIKDGFSEELDNLKNSIKDAQSWIAGLENTERERTGIKNLKVGFNKVFGYYLEVTRSYYDMIPDNYIRKQTLVNCERFITPELKETESLVLNAETKINQLEYDLFTALRKEVQKYIPKIQETASAIAALDVIISFAEVSSKLGYVKPLVHDGDEIFIKGGRHPVIEQTIRDGIFVSNDLYTNCSDASMLLITGPNMAGKSTYMRQTALIVLMAQAGCFVPCEYAKIGVVDRIFTRIGASDNLAQGQSTFFVEMSELAYILNCSTKKSLVILDEIGRGTSTYDGLSIAWAVVEHLCRPENKCRTLFATHYHELTSLEEQLPGCKNLNVEVSEIGGNVVFLHKIIEGSASRSYGIHVAKIAGVPHSILKAAQQKLELLETVNDKETAINAELSSYLESSEDVESGEIVTAAEGSMEQQLSFFSFAPNPVVEKLKNINLMDIKPSEAFGILEELQELASVEK